MKILVTNDDGIFARGLFELANALVMAGHELLIAAPEKDQSCVSHGLTLRRPLHARKTAFPELPSIRAYAVDGTPSDCIRLALGNLDFAPDVIVSGINDAPNLGSDAVYSATVSAAIEGFMVDVPSIAVAKDTFTTEHMDDAAGYFAKLLPRLMEFFKSGPGMLSVNIPSKKAEEYKGIRVASLKLQRYDLRFDEHVEEDGRIGYTVRSGKLTVCPEGEKTDERAMRDGYVVITPLTYDITEYPRMELAEKLFEGEC